MLPVRGRYRCVQISLLEALDRQQLNCLNEDATHTLRSIVEDKRLNTSSDVYLLSDADEQLILNIAVRPFPLLLLPFF